jgi:DNA-binding beta-propeller fold protein YncE
MVSFDTTIGPPPATRSFDISFVKDTNYILADRTNNAVDLFDAKALTFTPGGIGSGGFVGPGPAVCAVPHACAGPNGVLIDNNNHVWVADGPASNCTTADCKCTASETTSMVKEYILAVSSGKTGRLACLDTGGKFRADEMAFDPADNLLLVANDADGFLSLISTGDHPAIVDQFFYMDNDVGKPASARGLSTPGGGIEQPVWNPQQGFFYQALPQGTSVGRVDIFNPKPGKLVFLRSITVDGCTNGPSGLALNADRELLGACDNGVAVIDANSGRVTIIHDSATATLSGADEIWFDPGTNAWYVSTPGQLGVVDAGPGHAAANATHTGCCGHSVAAFTDRPGHSFVFDPNSAGTGISVFEATQTMPTTTHGPGDFDGNGFVDIRDYGMWRQSFGSSNCGIAVDATNNCTVDIRAYGTWRSNFGQGGAPTSTTPGGH